MRCLLAVHGTRRAATADTIDSLMPLLADVSCDVVVAAPEAWDLPCLTLGNYQADQLSQEMYGFRLLALLHGCIQSGRQYDVVLLTDDRCLGISGAPLKQGLKLWFEDHGLGAVGVADEHQRYAPFAKFAPLLARWDVRYAGWKPNRPPFLGGVLLLGKPLVTKLYSQGLLPPPQWREWPTTFGDFVSVMCEAFKLPSFSVGTPANPRNPLFVAGVDPEGRRLISPQLLREEFMIYHPVDQVYGPSEHELRAGYKNLRAGRR